jgi:hypothetical protein
MFKIHPGQNVYSQALAGFLDHWNLQLTHNLTPSSVTAEQILRADRISRLREKIFDSTDYRPTGFLFVFQKDCIETIRKFVVRGVVEEDEFENGLGEYGLGDIDVFARARRIIVALSGITYCLQ